MKQDKLYANKLERIQPFEFNEDVVNVFDDMIRRSVPLYEESITRQGQLIAKYYQEGTKFYDLGCYSGNIGVYLLNLMGEKKFEMIGVDNSAPMLMEYIIRLENRPNSDNIKLRIIDIQEIDLEEPSVIIINLTLQFLPLEYRGELIKKIYDSLLPGGILLLTEKIIHEDQRLTDLQQEFYYNFKKENNYSNLEISQKRDALGNVLVPETCESHMKRLSSCGFKKINIWMKWFNFASFFAQK